MMSCPQAKVLDRDGHKLAECPKGWQYNVDMAHTDVSTRGSARGCLSGS